MKQSLLFAPTLREIPREAEAVSHKILLRGGYIRQIASGVYAYLPLGYRVIRKIENIIREELDKIGCSEMLMPALQPKELWEESGRWNDYGKELMRLRDRHDRDFCLGPTHEEIITAVIRNQVDSYKKLPLALYQIQTKFRDEFRPRFGLMRGREFIMKDLYTFSATREDLDKWYEKVRDAYIKIMDRLELNYRIVSAASGPIGGSDSEEFTVLCDIGEDTIVYSDESDFASSYELNPLPEGSPSPDGKGKIRHAKGIETGHIFKLGTKYSEPMKAYFADSDGHLKPMEMGCYGIGVSRLLMAVAECHCHGDHVVWPKEIRPFDIHLLPIGKKGSENHRIAENLHKQLTDLGWDVLFDDRQENPGVKFNDADLIGIGNRLIVGKKAREGLIEYKNSDDGTSSDLTIEEILMRKF